MKRADNPNTSYMAWELLVPWLQDYFKIDAIRKSFEVVGAAIAREKPDKDGVLSLGRALAGCVPSGVDVADSPEATRLRRLLSCNDVEEACVVLRPILQYVASKGITICYAMLLKNLLNFNQRAKLQWAHDFYFKPQKGELAGDDRK